MAMKRLYLFGVLMLAILIGSSGSFAADSGRIVIISKALSWFEVYDSIGDKSLVDAVFDVGERYEVPDCQVFGCRRETQVRLKSRSMGRLCRLSVRWAWSVVM